MGSKRSLLLFFLLSRQCNGVWVSQEVEFTLEAEKVGLELFTMRVNGFSTEESTDGPEEEECA